MSSSFWIWQNIFSKNGEEVAPSPKTYCFVNQVVWETLLGLLLCATMYFFTFCTAELSFTYSTAGITVKSSQHHLFINWISSNMNFIYETKNLYRGLAVFWWYYMHAVSFSDIFLVEKELDLVWLKFYLV